MGADTKKLRNRIKSVNSTLHLTKAMGLVASSKIRKASLAMVKSREYLNTVRDVIDMLTFSPECAKSPYITRNGSRTRLVIIAGDRGLAGGYNANIFRLAKEFSDALFFPVGKRACDRYGEGAVSAENFSYDEAISLAKKLCAEFEADEFDRLGIICTKYVSVMTQEAQVKWILPLEKGEGKKSAGIVFEPDAQTIFNTAITEYIAAELVAAVREGFASEVAARRTAMDSAGKNAQQMIDDLQKEYNRARQGAITQEITEIVAGSGV